MSCLTNLTRMYLTRSTKPFQFKSEADDLLPYNTCNQLGLYVHIPFCKSICNFCPYCKTIYDKEKCNQYINALLEEITMVAKQSPDKKTVTSLYIGGGTPALAIDHLSKIIDTISQYFIITEGIGIELHPDDVTIPLLKKLKAAGITKISIGIQSFLNKYQSVLKRKAIDLNKLQTSLASVNFETVSMDFIFALPDQTFSDLKADIDMAFKLGANHIAIYPFIDFTFTTSKVKTMKKKKKRQLLDQITLYCLKQGYQRTSIWTFASNKNALYSSMTRNNFLGFGTSATTLLNDQFKINTFSIEEYCNRINHKKLPTSLTLRFTVRQRMIYYLFWNAYGMEINSDDFKQFFNVSLNKMYGLELTIARILGFLIKENNCYKLTLKGAFYYHYYENFYTLAYIDKMWGLLKDEAFPAKMDL